MFEAEPGVEREVWIWKLKAMSDSNNACLFLVHRGGCVIFHPKDFRKSMIYMARRMNVGVVSPDYRLAPEHKMPAGIGDAGACFHFMSKNADNFVSVPTACVWLPKMVIHKWCWERQSV